jgi:glycosyltransferase involved in cell wall biosynthesis
VAFDVHFQVGYPVISFVIPAYNEETMICDCLRSIRKEMFAANIPYEIIVVDNASTDQTATIARDYGATIVNEPNKSVTKARQAGFESSLYSLVAFIDADSQLPIGWFDYLLEDLNGKNVVAVTGPYVYRDLWLPSRICVFFYYWAVWLVHHFLPMTHGGNLVVQKSALRAAGGFDTSIEFHGDDTAVAKRLSKQGIIVFSPDMFVYTSGRRLRNEGLFLTGFQYFINWLWVWVTGHPWSHDYKDIRE